MRWVELGLLVYGFTMIGFFGLSLMAFLGNPISAALDFNAASGLIATIVGGFLLLVLYYYMTERKHEPRTNLSQPV